MPIFLPNQLSQREFITLGIISRNQKILTTQLYKELQLPEEERLRSYVNRLLEHGLISSRGLRKGTKYLINPQLIANAKRISKSQRNRTT